MYALFFAGAAWFCDASGLAIENWFDWNGRSLRSNRRSKKGVSILSEGRSRFFWLLATSDIQANQNIVCRGRKSTPNHWVHLDLHITDQQRADSHYLFWCLPTCSKPLSNLGWNNWPSEFVRFELAFVCSFVFALLVAPRLLRDCGLLAVDVALSVFCSAGLGWFCTCWLHHQ